MPIWLKLLLDFINVVAVIFLALYVRKLHKIIRKMLKVIHFHPEKEEIFANIESFSPFYKKVKK